MMEARRTTEAESPGDLQAPVTGANSFALDLYSQLRGREGNLLFSPHSISLALAMAYAGARGETAREMASTLHLDPDNGQVHAGFGELRKGVKGLGKSGDVRLSVANSVWSQEGEPLLAAYLALLEQHYGAPARQVDFAGAAEAARQLINGWVEEETDGAIRELVGEGDLDPLTRLLLTNAIYFKGRWAHRFDPEGTREADFFPVPGQKRRVAMMQQKGRFSYGETSEARLLELPYAGQEVSMIAILPENADALSVLEAQLTGPALASWLSSLSEQEVAVQLPRFKMTWGSVSLDRALINLGMRTPFGAAADFSGMDGRGGLFISKVLHKAHVEVNEEGSEAAAATAVVMTRGVPRTVLFRADHPFIFLIRENRKGDILFLGRLWDPEG